MLIGIEGCIGAGKTTLLQLFSHVYPCYPVYEEIEGNPFVEDFCQKAGKRLFARHLLYSSLFLQERQLRRALLLSEQGQMVVTDFHPLRNIIFVNAYAMLRPVNFDRPLFVLRFPQAEDFQGYSLC